MSQVLVIWYYWVFIFKLILVPRHIAPELRAQILESDRLGFKSCLYHYQLSGLVPTYLPNLCEPQFRVSGTHANRIKGKVYYCLQFTLKCKSGLVDG